SQDDKLVALDISTGEQRWIYESSLPVLTVRGHSTPVVTLHRVYAGLASGRVVALDARNGLPVCEQRIAQPQVRSELERMVASGGGVALDARNCLPVWAQRTSQPQGPSALGRMVGSDGRLLLDD